MTDIYIVRHGETTSNRDGLWQGITDSALTATGREQVERLSARLASTRFDAVVASDLGRTQTTAAALNKPFETSSAWREPDLGEWEGKTSEQVRQMSGPDMDKFMRGEDVRLGGAGTLSEAASRMIGAYRDLVGKVGPHGSALAVTHGLAIAVLTGVLFQTRFPNPLGMASNTGLLRLSSVAGSDRLHVHNDTTHLVDSPISHGRGTEVIFIRHGETFGNLEDRWQGQQDGALTDEGRAQAKAAVAGLPDLDVLYTSRLGRAVETAEIIGAGLGLTPTVVDGVEELGFGDWENLTTDEIRATDPEGAYRFFDLGEDIARGGNGETWAALQERVAATARDLADRHKGRRIGVVSHGGATRAFANQVLANEFSNRHAIAPMRNTAYATFEVGSELVRILHWNIAPHLEI
jgi:broad specificity phosphatase PhoE